MKTPMEDARQTENHLNAAADRPRQQSDPTPNSYSSVSRRRRHFINTCCTISSATRTKSFSPLPAGRKLDVSPKAHH